MASSSTRTLSPCLVCGDKSIGFNFGVMSCMPCKAFFRRNAVKLGNYDFVCPKDGDCPVTHTFRRLCICCRLAKCFRVGMQKELILTEAAKEARRQSAAQHRAKRKNVSQNNSLNLVQISHPPHSTYHQTSFLSFTDQTLLRNIFNVYESTCIAAKNSEHPDFPRSKHTNLFAYVNEYSSSSQALIEYFKFIPEFNHLCINDRVCLIRNQFGIVNNINEAIIHPGITTNLVISLSNVFGVHLANRLLQSIERRQLFASDTILLKLLLIVLALSNGTHRNRNDTDMDQICSNPVAIFTAQNIYVELLWKYILSRSSTEFNAVKLFDKLVQFLLYLVDVHMLVDGYINNLPNEINQMEPLMQSMWPSPNIKEIHSIKINDRC